MDFSAFKFFADAMPEGILLVSGTGQLISVNKAAERLLHKPRTEIEGKHLALFCSLSESEATLAIQPSFRSRRPTYLKIDFGKSSKNTQVYPQGFLLRSNANKEEALALVRLVTETPLSNRFLELDRELLTHKKLLDSLSKSRTELKQRTDRFDTTLKSIADAVISIDSNAIIDFMNPVAELLTGWRQEEACGLHLTEVFKVFDESTAKKVKDPLLNILAHSKTVDRDHHHVLIDRGGSSVGIEYTASEIHDSNGNSDGIVLVFQDVTHARALQKELVFQAKHDSLTGLRNRRAFETHVEHLIEDSIAEKNEHILLYLDLDQFKVVNDTCGHFAGDELLKQVSGLLQMSVRKHDVLARLGGDEFGVVLSYCSLEKAEAVAQGIIDSINNHPFVWEMRTFRIGVSIGMAVIDSSTLTLVEPLKYADTACYMAKEAGRNCYYVYSSSDEHTLHREGQLNIVNEIHDALRDNRFQLYVQHIAALKESDHQHYEILLRMVNSEGNLVSPGLFLPAAERFNIISKIDMWVLGETFKQCLENPEFFAQHNSISINLSGASLTSDTVLSFITQQLTETGVNGEHVIFEITETAAIANLSQAMKFIATMSQFGCRFALDDFGSGLSSFAYLKNFAVDYLKIDGMFVKDIVYDPIDLAMVKSINDIGHVMGIKTVAEFVENDEILNELKLIGVDYVQGYGVHRPELFTNILERLRPKLVKS